MKGTTTMVKGVLPVVVVLLGLSALCVRASESAAPKADVQKKLAVVCDAYPGLAWSSLAYARLADLPAGTLLKTQNLTLTETDIAGEIAGVPQEVQTQLKRHAFFVLENLATRRTLLALARVEAPEQNDTASSDEQETIQKYLKGSIGNVEVTDSEVAKFYEENKDACSGATLNQVRDQLKQLVLQQKQQNLMDEYVRTLGQRMAIEVSASWTKEQARLARGNLVDRARSSRRPSLVDFGSTGCVGCDMLAPILETLKKKYAGKANVLFIHVGREQALASRYGIQAIPTQVFYDRDGKEVFRHVGFWPQAEIEKKLAQMGVR